MAGLTQVFNPATEGIYMTTTVTGVNTSADIPSTATTTGSTALGKDSFLLLLTTQLQNQDPTAPVSNTEFVAQLAQFSSLEEMQTISGQLDSLYLVNASMNNAAMVNLLGKDVVAQSDTFHHSSGSEDIHFDAASATTSTTLTITNADGTIVFSGEIGAEAAGEGSYSWDGKDESGALVPDGDYTFALSGSDVNGSDVTVTSLIEGTVDQMSFTTGAAAPSINGIDIAMGDIVRIVDTSGS